MPTCSDTLDLASGIGPQWKPLSEMARRLPGTKGRDQLHPATLHRWAMRGKAIPGGGRIYLETKFIGAQRCTTAEALADFLDRLDAGRNRRVRIDPPHPPRTRASAQAEAELIRLGC